MLVVLVIWFVPVLLGVVWEILERRRQEKAREEKYESDLKSQFETIWHLKRCKYEYEFDALARDLKRVHKGFYPDWWTEAIDKSEIADRLNLNFLWQEKCAACLKHKKLTHYFGGKRCLCQPCWFNDLKVVCLPCKIEQKNGGKQSPNCTCFKNGR